MRIEHSQLLAWILYSLEITQMMSKPTKNNKRRLQKNPKHVSHSHEFHVSECNDTSTYRFALIIAHMACLDMTLHLELTNHPTKCASSRQHVKFENKATNGHDFRRYIYQSFTNNLNKYMH